MSVNIGHLDWRDLGIVNKTVLELQKMVPRADFDVSAGINAVRPILEKVRTEGLEAVYRYTAKFDGVDLSSRGIRVAQNDLKIAFDNLDPELLDAILEAKNRITRVHESQLPKGHVTTLADGATVTQRHIPIRRVGLYVPGGLAVYPSSVLMNAIPALVAGSSSIVIASPPQKAFGGLPHPTILACAYILGITEVYAVGGAVAIALMAYGAKHIEPVDLITGPGNIYVASAKHLVQGTVGIDAVAGPTEIGIIADESANPKYIAKDLIGQAEHDTLAGSVLFTDSANLIEQVQKELDAELDEGVSKTKHNARVKTALEGKQSALILLNNLDECIAVANAYGAEHLEIHTENPESVADKITNAGAIFVGPYSPVPLGDYIGGSNHVLPTGGASKFSSGLSTYTFLRSVQQIQYTRSALDAVTDKLVTFANNEDLPAHGEAALARRTLSMQMV